MTCVIRSALKYFANFGDRSGPCDRPDCVDVTQLCKLLNDAEVPSTIKKKKKIIKSYLKMSF